MSTQTEQMILNPESVLKVLGYDTKQVMVYGFEDAKYKLICDALNSKKYGIQRVFDWNLGEACSECIRMQLLERRGTLEREIIEVFPTNYTADSKHMLARTCKAAMTGLIFENFKRKKQGQSIIPLLFCAEYIDNQEKIVVKSSSQRVTSKEKILNERIAHSELRRAYRHCKECEQSEYPEMRELAKVAQETFTFARVEKEADGRYSFISLRPIWEDPEWEPLWKKRLETHSKEQSTKAYKWREQLLKKVRDWLFYK